MAYKAQKTGVQELLELRFYGAEPDIETSYVPEDWRLHAAFNWYNVFFDQRSHSDWLADELKNRKYSPKDISAVMRCGRLMPSDFYIARMLSRDCTLPERTVKRWEARIKEYLIIGKIRREEIVSSPDRASPAVHNRRKALNFIGDIDELMDQVWLNQTKLEDVKFFEFFKTLGMKPSQAGIITNHYKMQLDDMNDKTIDHGKRAVHQRLLAFVKSLVESLVAWSGTVADEKVKVKGAVKRGRKPKVARPAATARSLKYKKTDEETKLTSVDPKHILGAQIVVLYNAKYSQLAILRASKPEGLSVKGTTILNVDEETSEAKRAGRHLSIIKEMVSAPKTKITKLFQSIKSTPIDVRTRTSDDVVIVRVIK